MKTIEIKKIGLISAMKITAVLMIIPAILFFAMGVVMVVASLASGASQFLPMGGSYIIKAVAIIPLECVACAVLVVLYNFSAIKIGGLEILIEEKAGQPR